eukprot:1464884-Rhodomonas_salina.2
MPVILTRNLLWISPPCSSSSSHAPASRSAQRSLLISPSHPASNAPLTSQATPGQNRAAQDARDRA